MDTASAGLVAIPQWRKPSVEGRPLTLGALCLVVAALGALLGVALGGASGQAALAAAQGAAANKLEQQLLASRDQLGMLDRGGVLQEAKDYEEAHRVGLAHALEPDLARMAPDDARRVLAALVREGRRHGLEPALLAGVIRVETRFDPYAVSHMGARGLMQLMPATAAEVAQKRGLRVTTGQLFNPVVNIELGTAYLKALIDRFGDLRTALIAYNAGPTLARTSRLSPGVRAYPRNVLAEYERIAWQARRMEAAPMAASSPR